MDKLKLARREIAELTGESLSIVDDAIKAGHLETFIVGRRRFATPAAARAWVAFLKEQSDRGVPVIYRARAAERKQAAA